MVIRLERPEDHQAVEEMTREAFWNLHVPGCDEHHLVHRMRAHEDFLPNLALVASDGDEIVGSILHTRSHLVASDDTRLDTLTFGPLCVRKTAQRRGIGEALVARAAELGTRSGFPAMVIEGHPKNYCRWGFRGSDAFHVADHQGRYPFGLLVRELVTGILGGRSWRFHHSPVYDETIDPSAFETYDSRFPPLGKRFEPSQEEFRIACGSIFVGDGSQT